MKKETFSRGAFPFLLILLIVLSSCTTGTPEIGEDWNKEMFFKSAQEAFDEDLLERSLFYYDVFLLRYPNDREKGIAAEYERAYIYYKWGEYDQSEELFSHILDRYNNDPYAYLYPQAYRILSEKVLIKIEENRAIEELPFFRRGAARRELMGTGVDETVEYEPQAPSEFQ